MATSHMQITRADILRATDESRDPWSVSDSVLYQLCQEYPNHRDTKGVTAKMLLIGRTYAATAERGRSAGPNPESSNDTFYTVELPKAIKASRLDAIMTKVRSHQRITPANAEAILTAHTDLMNTLRGLTGVSKRSLASKYLHFHEPDLFFIFDTRAVCAMRTVAKRKRKRGERLGWHVDQQYAAFVEAALSLRDDLEAEFDIQLRPRHIDRILLHVEASLAK